MVRIAPMLRFPYRIFLLMVVVAASSLLSAFGDWFPRGREVILPLFVANGVTGVRDMGGDLPVLFAWRKEIAAGEIVGPRMVVSGPMLDGYLPDGKLRFPSSTPVTTPADAVKAVDSLKAQGAE